jgi:spermidine synthase
MVVASGMAGLSWEILWQLRAGLAIGVSAKGTAITLACVMFGLAGGATLMGRWLRQGRRVAHPIRLFGTLELLVGLCGLLLGPGFAAIEALDTSVYQSAPGLAPVVQMVGILVLLCPPALAMGATVPTFALLARTYRRTSVAALYGLNTAGAALGVLVASFVLLPALGVTLCASAIASVNIAVCLAAWLYRKRGSPAEQGTPSVADDAARPAAVTRRQACLVVLVTGLVTFCLEVAWFRSLRAAFQSTTDSFAIMLVAVLVPLALGARLALRLPATRRTLATVLALAGALVLLATPLIERFDTIDTLTSGSGYWTTILLRLGMALVALGAPMLMLGTALPWVLERHREASEVGWLYGLNTLGAMVGSLGAAWILLPALGSARTAWLSGLIVAAVAVSLARGSVRWVVAGMGLAAAAVAISTESGVGELRAQGLHLRRQHKVLAMHEGPDATVSVIEYPGGRRDLIIDGFQASSEARNSHYMPWMGRLPMLMHRRPRRALVICFGSGQTAHAVLQEGPEHLDVVELSEAVIRVSPLFTSNRGVLNDPRVRTIVMDGRAWLRRTDERYDIVTLEPMPPYFAGTNSLYSEQFYQLVAARLRPGGVVAQWLPIHLVSPEDGAAIAHTLQAVFPNAWLWFDPVGRTGILVGRRGGVRSARPDLPGLERPAPGRDLSQELILSSFLLGPDQVARYGRFGRKITDDNQLLAWGSGRRDALAGYGPMALHGFNEHLLNLVRKGHPSLAMPKD